MENDTLRSQQALEQIRKFKIEADRDPRKEFKHRYFGAEAIPNRTEFEADRARADHEQFLRRFRKAKRFSAADDCFAVKLRERQLNWSAAGRNHDVLCFELLRLVVR